MASFFRELKRRNVYKVAIAYAAVAWLSIQLASILFPTFDAASWVMKVFVAVVALGFPLALIFAWAFEMTPEGLKRTEDVAPNESATRGSGRKLDFAIIAVLALAIAILLFDRFRSHPQARGAKSRDKSIAVLPFENLSSDPENAYFATGVQDEILTRLSRIGDLKVISRTSTQKYRSAPENLREIAQQLGVAHVLEGSVQRAGDQVRITVQLINALSDAHIWADSYDRSLSDIFKVQSEIAKSVADSLQAKLTGSERQAIAARPTENTGAYQLYLKGRFFWNKRTGDDLRKALDYFNQAVAADPNYALAYAGIADAYNLLPTYSAETPQECYPQAEAAARKALELDPTLAEARTALAAALVARFDFAAAEQEFKRAIELNPNYATAHQWYSDSVLAPNERFQEAFVSIKRALELDPLSPIINAEYGGALNSIGRSDEALQQFRKTIELEPRFPLAHAFLGDALLARGNHAAAIAAYQKSFELGGGAIALGALANAYGVAGQKDEALKIIAELHERRKREYVAAYCFALAHVGIGEKDEAIRWLEQGYADGAATDMLFLRMDPLLRPLRDEPRFKKLVDLVYGAPRAAPPPAR